jgi:hypothetical protein
MTEDHPKGEDARPEHGWFSAHGEPKPGGDAGHHQSHGAHPGSMGGARSPGLKISGEGQRSSWLFEHFGTDDADRAAPPGPSPQDPHGSESSAYPPEAAYGRPPGPSLHSQGYDQTGSQPPGPSMSDPDGPAPGHKHSQSTREPISAPFPLPPQPLAPGGGSPGPTFAPPYPPPPIAPPPAGFLPPGSGSPGPAFAPPHPPPPIAPQTGPPPPGPQVHHQWVPSNVPGTDALASWPPPPKGPYDDLRESWLRRVMRRLRGGT